ncbi:endo alpha-1,4 polygalactosaminidase [Pseudonocardia hispaniensis]|uniref:Endo alpha-1,4 polygalactosaminidase n=1 Tax=Pseudonocardia hispaniensis TaxID=904933 RepID=A0ABW1J253_9PSEU
MSTVPGNERSVDTHRAGTPTGVPNFAIQLQNYPGGHLDQIAHGGFELVVIDLARDAHRDYFTADEIRRLKGATTTVLAYFEIGSVENFRPDFSVIANDQAQLLLNEWRDWPGEYFVKYWEPRWWELAVQPRIDRALAAGFDGVFLDTPLAYEEIDLGLVPDRNRNDLGHDMVELIKRISAYGKSTAPGFLVFPLNSPELQRYPGYAEAIDGIAMESLFFRPMDRPCDDDYCATDLAAARALRKAGKTVLAIDYADRPENVTQACRRYREEGFAGYLTTRSLDTLRPRCS